tara:strand:- start:477 stop:713 length:237 start_codon:yes stop_codon:yes gene_type:complete
MAAPDTPRPAPAGLSRVLLWVHNLAFWFFLVPFFTSMSYETGFAIYAAILFVRFLANTWTDIKDFTWEQYYAFPLRIP